MIAHFSIDNGDFSGNPTDLSARLGLATLRLRTNSAGESHAEKVDGQT